MPRQVPDARTSEKPAVELAVEITKADQDIEEEQTTQKTDISDHPTVLIELNASVQKWIDIFTGPERERFERYLRRGSRYRKLVEESLIEQGIPKEFYYLAMIESGYSTHATSSAKAVGIWQFIRGTGQRYGLRCDRGVDERRDPARATRAAAQYLKDLYNVFGSWRLAMAAYNAGERRILSAIMNGNTRDFWTLAEKRVLPAETMDYVPKFFAAAIIGEKPEKYGFAASSDTEPWEADRVEVPSPVRLAAVSRETRVSVADLKALNPHLLHHMTPADTPRYALYFPSGNLREIQAAASRLTALKAVASKPVGRRLAAAPSVRASRLSSGRIAVGEKRKVRKARASDTLVYRVKPGDTLVRISSQFGVPVRQLRKLNKLRSSAIYTGQALKIKSDFL